MGPSQEITQNPVLGNSLLNSKFFNPTYWFDKEAALFRKTYEYIPSPEVLSIIHLVLWFLAFFFITIICYATVRMFEIRRKEKEHLKHEIAEYAKHQAEKAKKMKEEGDASRNPRWAKTLTYLFSDNMSDWKLAIIEADSMFEELMNQLGFQGESLGEKLKSATQENFKGLSAAWEAHTVRNRIAHEGINFELSEREAKRVVALYEDIFRAYGFI